ncbi:hypothetical protein PUN28_018809 [Cardiocondyla obscurior]|uniref:Transforming acidic coiled-coil-containing protein C-terminal domain-containing protein n=1 Tax=Cardiocondyla obscurior TaxID=286306 RepID=A0AAW2EG44_9HYME
MEYINKLFHRSVSAEKSPSPIPASGNDNPVTAAKTEHEIKVRFAREFADVGSTSENIYLARESLSSASSFHSLSSAFSTKSSSGICLDSTSEIVDDVDTSYINSNIPGVEDLILACADIHLESECDLQDQDLSQDQTFRSAIDEIPFPTSESSLNEDLLDNAGNETQVLKSSPSHEASLNETPSLELPSNRLPVQESQPATSHLFSGENVPPQESADTVNEAEACNVANDIAKDSLPTSSENNDQLNVETTVSSSDTTFNVITSNEKQGNDCTSEILSVENPQLYPVEISVPSTFSLAPHADVSSSSVTNISELDDTVIKTKETSSGVQVSGSEIKPDISAELSSVDNLDAPSQTINNSVVEEKRTETNKEQEPQLDSCIILHREDNTQSLNETSTVESNTSEVENLQTSIDKKDLETENNVVVNEIQELSKKEAATCNETHVIEKQYNLSETVIIEKCNIDSTAAANSENDDQLNVTTTVSSSDTAVVITPNEKQRNDCASEALPVEDPQLCCPAKSENPTEDLDRTLTLQEVDLNFEELNEEQYEKFKPQRQSTTLNEPSYLKDIQSPVDKVTNDILNPSLDFTDDLDNFVTATPAIFEDPSTFDFLLARSNNTHANRLRTESLYVKFDPLVSNANMLPQGNVQTINEEKNSKNESPLADVDTPKRNPAIAAIDRLLFYSPLPNTPVQKLEEVKDKNEEPAEEPKSNAPLIDVDMSKELTLVKTTVLQLEEALEKQKKEREVLEKQKKDYEEELERQKATFQEKINKLQAQMAQEKENKTNNIAVVVEEYEKTISRLTTAREKDKAKLQEELQAANHHLTNTEAAFNDVHQKYERLKGVVSVYKNNETVLKESIQENVETIKTLEARYEQLKGHAMTQLEKANLELDGIRKQHEAETVKLHAMIKKAELKSNSLAELVEQKTKENEELTKILDELIARVGHGNSE